jgi:N-ethylmaleimide reductase
VVGQEHIGIRVSPFGKYNDMQPFSDKAETWLAAGRELSAGRSAQSFTQRPNDDGPRNRFFRLHEEIPKSLQRSPNPRCGFLKDNAQAAIDTGSTDLIAIGRPFIAILIW